MDYLIEYESVCNAVAVRKPLMGRDHFVVPMSMIVPGVLNGSKGPLLYPKEETAKNPSVWNGMPIVVNHPNGSSARVPEYLDKFGIGIILNAKGDDSGKLVAEGWFDIERTKAVDNRIYENLQSGKKIELSTGVNVAIDTQVGDNPVFNGVKYEGIARNLRPDHLAILPDDKGACSLEDGCGVNNTSKNWKDRLEQVWNAVFHKNGSSQTEKDQGMALTAEQKAALVAEVTNCSCGGKAATDADKAAMNTLSDEAILALHKMVTTKKTEPEKSPNEKQEVKTIVVNELTADQKELLEYAKNKKAEERMGIIKALTDSVPADQRQAQVLNLSGKTLAELVELKKTVDALNAGSKEEGGGADFSGQAPAPEAQAKNSGNKVKPKEETPLELPAWNWASDPKTEEG